MNLKITRIFSVASLLLTTMVSLVEIPAHAQDPLGTLEDLMPETTEFGGRRSMNGRIKLFRNHLVHPMPVWSSFADGPAPAEKTKIQTANAKGLYKMSMVPQDEDFENWQNIFTVVAHENSSRGVRQTGLVVANQFRTICSPANTQIFKVDLKPHRLIQLVVCGQFSRDRAKGQMAALVTLRNPTGLVTLSRQWRSPAFQSKVTSDWPISKLEVDRVMAELAKSRLIPIN